MTIETEISGVKVTYSENEDVWRSWELDLEGKTLSALRTKINKWLSDRRRLSNVPVLKTTEYGLGEEFTAVMIDQDGKSIWCYAEKRKGSRGERTKNSGDTLTLDTPTARRMIEKANQIEAEISALRKQRSSIIAALPRLTGEEIAKLPRDMPDEALPPPRKRSRR